MQIIIQPTNMQIVQLHAGSQSVVFCQVWVCLRLPRQTNGKVAAEFLHQCHQCNEGATISEYTSLPRQEAFNIGMWLLEEQNCKNAQTKIN
jgi:rhamnose utilization protein RhaD (predicted bifunctional aldolase and dehydrogenase)